MFVYELSGCGFESSCSDLGCIEFKNYKKQIPAPLKIYADFESLLKSCGSGIDNDCFSYTSKYQDHVPYNFANKLVCVNDKYSKYVLLYRGKKCSV